MTHMRYIIFLSLPKKIEHNIGVVRKNFRAKSLSLWPSHITIKYDENYTLSQKKFIEIATNFYRKRKPLSIVIGKPKIRFMKNSVRWNIYLPVTSQRLKTLVKRFSKIVENFIDAEAPGARASTKWEQSRNFQLHISLKGGTGKVAGEKMYKKLREQDFGFKIPSRVTCTSVTIAKWENSRWKKIRTITLIPS